MAKITREDALEYHRLKGKPGKIAVVPTKPMDTQRDLGLAYTPAWPSRCWRSRRTPSWPTNTPPRATWWPSSPTAPPSWAWATAARWPASRSWKAKGVLFKKFADVDVFDIEVDTHDPDEIIRVVAAIAPTFGGINLEDIKAPECFYIEEDTQEDARHPGLPR